MRALRVALLAAIVPVLLTGCGGTNGGRAQPTVTVTVPASSGGTTPASGASQAPASRPGIVAVTTAGALVRLDPVAGNVTQTLVSGGVIGDEISVSPDGSTVYFAQGAGCKAEVESIAIGGGTPAPIAAGELPAISPDGSKLAIARQPLFSNSCTAGDLYVAKNFKLVIRTLRSGTEQVLPLPPRIGQSGLFPPISHLSWAADSVRLAVSLAAVQDNEGWGLDIVDTSAAKYYLPPGSGVTNVPVSGSPSAQRSYLREGVFLPDGNLFISRACCGGVPVRNTSRLMWEVTTSGALVHQVAIGYPNLDHVSLAASGQWLLYLAGNDLYISQNGNMPVKLTGGLIAAAWV